MSRKRWVYAVLLSGALALSVAAQESQEGQDEAPPAQPEPAEPAPPPDDGRTLEEIFIPSEEIGADEEVTFPINI